MRHVTLGRPAEAQGSGDLRLIVAYIVPIAGHDLYGVRPGFPPAAGLDPGVLWSRRQLAVGASVPHTNWLPCRQAVAGAETDSQYRHCRRSPDLYRVGGRDYQFQTKIRLVVVVGPQYPSG